MNVTDVNILVSSLEKSQLLDNVSWKKNSTGLTD
jgi:hypothetical protein